MKRFATVAACALAVALSLGGCSDATMGFVPQGQGATYPSYDATDPDGANRGGGEQSEELEDKRYLSDGTAYEWDGELINYRAEWEAFLGSLPSLDALDVLESLDMAGLASAKGYDRERFGERWVDVDGNGCNTRNDILGRDLTDIVYTSNKYRCIVQSGELDDPYSGQQVHFERSDSEAVQIDHIVALYNAWRTGAQEMSEVDRIALANDPYNLVAVDGEVNFEKSDGDASRWLPEDKDFRCEYMARQIGVKARYNLWVTKAEKKALKAAIKAECPGLTLPAYDSIR